LTSFPKGFVGITVDKMQRLAAIVDKNGQALYRAGGQVQDILSGCGLSTAAGKTIGRVGDEMMRKAPDLRNRYQLAVAMDKEGDPFSDVSGAPPGVTVIDEADLGHIKAIQQAREDAQLLNQALGNKDTATSRKDILAIARNLRSHLHDKAYLSAFWAMAAPDAAKLAGVLSDQHHDHSILHSNPDKDKIVLTADDKKILAAFGASLAAASRKKVFSSDNWGAVTRPDNDNYWSANMLLRYGPNGSQWDPFFLAQWARDTLDRRRNRMAQETYQDYQVSLEFYRTDSSSPVGQEYEPTLTLLQRLGENRAASRLLLGDKVNGLTYTRDLINPSWFAHINPVDRTSPEMDFSHYAGNVLKAAAYQKRGNGIDSELSTRAVANIVHATNEYKSPDGSPILPGGLRHALTDVAIAYIPDFAASAGHRDQDPNNPDPSVTDAARDDIKGSPWIVYTTKSQLESFLGEALYDPADLGRYRAAVDGQFSPAMRVAIQTERSGSGHEYFMELANLRGLTQDVEASLHYSHAQKKDADAAANQRLFDMMFGGFGNMPVQKVGTHQFVSGILQPAMDSAFDTDHAARVADQNKQDARNLALGMNVPVVQGLIDAGSIKRSDMPPLRNGKIVTGRPFDIWYSTHSSKSYGGKELSDWVLMAEHGVERQTG
jgi:hypothetical protein